MDKKAKNTQKHNRWIFVILGIIIFICLGTVYSWSVFKTPFEKLYNVDAAQSSLPYLIFLLSYTAFMLISGKAVDRFNPKVIIGFGGLLVGAGWILSGLVQNFTAVVLFYGLMSGAGVGIVYGVPIKVVSNWFVSRRGLALGLLLSGFGLSPFITAPLIEFLLAKTDINHTFIYIGLAFIVIIPVLGMFFSHPSEETLSKRVQTKRSRRVKSLIRKPEFIGLWLCFAIGATVGLMIIGVSGQIGKELFNIDSTTAAYLISFFAVLNAAGRPIFGFLTDKIKPLKTIFISFSLILLACLLLFVLNTQSVFVFVICIGILWMNLGAWLSIAPTATAQLFDAKNYSRNYGLVFTAYGAGALLGTPFAGIIRTTMGSYKFIFLPAAIFSAVGIVLAYIFLHKKQAKKQNV